MLADRWRGRPRAKAHADPPASFAKAHQLATGDR